MQVGCVCVFGVVCCLEKLQVCVAMQSAEPSSGHTDGLIDDGWIEKQVVLVVANETWAVLAVFVRRTREED